MGSVVDFALSPLKQVVGSITGASDASDAAMRGAETQAAYQSEALNYLKENQAVPLEYRDKAIKDIYDYFSGNPFSAESQQAQIEAIKSQPMYNKMIDDATQQVLRSKSVTGTRGGSSQAAIAGIIPSVTQDLLNRQQSLESQKYAGLSGLAGIPINTGQVAQLQSGIGQTYAQGQTAAEQAQQQGMNQLLRLGAAAIGYI